MEVLLFFLEMSIGGLAAVFDSILCFIVVFTVNCVSNPGELKLCILEINCCTKLLWLVEGAVEKR